MKLHKILEKVTKLPYQANKPKYFTQKNRPNSYYTYNGVQIILVFFGKTEKGYISEHSQVADFDHYQILHDNWIFITKEDISNMQKNCFHEDKRRDRQYKKRMIEIYGFWKYLKMKLRGQL